MRYCLHCGSGLPEENRFCNQCGKAADGHAGKMDTAIEEMSGKENHTETRESLRNNTDSPFTPVPVSKKRTGSNNKILIFSCILAVIILVTSLWGWQNYGTEARVQKKLDIAVKYLSQSDYEKAILAFNEAIQIDPMEVQSYQGLARTYTLQGNWEEAKAAYDKGLLVVETGKRQVLQIGLGGMYIDKNDLAQAEKAFQELKDLDPRCLESYFGLSIVYQKQGEIKKAESILRQAVANNPNEYRAYNALAVFLKQHGKEEESASQIVKSLSININQQEAYLVLQDIYDGKWKDLRDMSIGIKDQKLSAMLEFYSYYAAGDNKKAVDIYQDLLGKQPENYKARILCAIAMTKLGHQSDAQQLIREINSNNLAEFLFSDMAMYYFTAQDLEKAREFAEKALLADAGNLEAIALLQTMNTADATVKIYTARALIYSWKPVTLMKEELRAKSLLGGDPPINASAKLVNKSRDLKTDKAPEPARDQVTLDTSLIEAVEKGDINKVENLLAQGANVNAKNKNGSNALGRACIWGHEDIAAFLLENGASVSNRNKWGATPLMDAALRGRSTAARLIIEHGADVNARDYNGYTALMEATMVGNPPDEHEGCLEVARLLLEAGADPNLKNQYGDTALKLARLAGYADMIDLLTAHGAR